MSELETNQHCPLRHMPTVHVTFIGQLVQTIALRTFNGEDLKRVLTVCQITAIL